MIHPRERLTATRPGHGVAKASYDLRASQIETPRKIVKFFWDVVHGHRSHLGSVFDMGAGDGKFASYGNYKSYKGVEIDPTRIRTNKPRKSAEVIQGCVFSQPEQAFDACIGNPPYLRHQDIESPWKEETISKLGNDLGVTLNGTSNLFLYFMVLGLIRTTATGLAAMLVPFDWVSRPAAQGLRHHILKQRWDVSVYRFSTPVFSGVDTTASISVIDKRSTKGLWSFYDVDENLQVTQRHGVTGTGLHLLEYSSRGRIFARRGLSPGSQHLFTLTDEERKSHGLFRRDVLPCVTTLRRVTETLDVLDRDIFEREFVRAGRRCWLIRSREKLSGRLRRYLESAHEEQRKTATCLRQSPWYRYEAVAAPALLLHSGFTGRGPRVLINHIRAIPVGAMYGIYGCPVGREKDIRAQINAHRISSSIVPHSGRLKKIEVGQLNAVLSGLEEVLDD